MKLLEGKGIMVAFGSQVVPLKNFTRKSPAVVTAPQRAPTKLITAVHVGLNLCVPPRLRSVNVVQFCPAPSEVIATAREPFGRMMAQMAWFELGRRPVQTGSEILTPPSGRKPLHEGLPGTRELTLTKMEASVPTTAQSA
jgi:hypothetical protein